MLSRLQKLEYGPKHDDAGRIHDPIGREMLRFPQRLREGSTVSADAHARESVRVVKDGGLESESSVGVTCL